MLSSTPGKGQQKDQPPPQLALHPRARGCMSYPENPCHGPGPNKSYWFDCPSSLVSRRRVWRGVGLLIGGSLLGYVVVSYTLCTQHFFSLLLCSRMSAYFQKHTILEVKIQGTELHNGYVMQCSACTLCIE